jgi:hypothetical protein
MDEDATCMPPEGVVLVPFDPRPLPATLRAYADQIREVQALARDLERDHDSPQL